jgi:hypothetical protein
MHRLAAHDMEDHGVGPRAEVADRRAWVCGCAIPEATKIISGRYAAGLA